MPPLPAFLLACLLLPLALLMSGGARAAAVVETPQALGNADAEVRVEGDALVTTIAGGGLRPRPKTEGR